ncbi:diphthine--ammonia ligase [Cetobacterium sp.]|uniref:Dph6-related ATP pyrophosphatase n=1 Tax=Cetobacterium sp. TaxID=2071632 RepID=UPI002FC6EADD
MAKKVVVSFSGGKDSMLSLHKAIQDGFEPIAIMTTINNTKGESWFHNISIDHLKQVSASLSIPLLLVECSGENYELSFENALKAMKDLGAEGCVFGDIDIEEHRTWCSNRCNNVNLTPIFPLWNGNREELVKEFISLGYKAMIKKVNLKNMGMEFLGETLSVDLLEKIKITGSDVCGENGEYHTFVYDGPLFSRGIQIEILEKRSSENIGWLMVC